MEIITKILFDNQDLKYKEFNSKIIPNINKEEIIGVSLPIIRKMAKELYQEPYIEEFLNELPHKYHEEFILHGIILTLKYKDIDILLNKLDIFLPHVNSWMITDVISPKIFKKHKNEVYQKINLWIKSEDEYVTRFAIVSLLQFYLEDDTFNKEILELVKNINSEYYYVSMAIAWFYSVALVKQYDETIKYFEERKLDKWIHNKSIQKAIESLRINEEQKKYLKSLKIK